MSIRAHILHLLSAEGILPTDEIQSALGENHKKRMQDNLRATANDGLIEMRRDDVTHMAAWCLTDKGREWVQANPANKYPPLPNAPDPLAVEPSDPVTAATKLFEHATRRAERAEAKLVDAMRMIAQIRAAVDAPAESDDGLLLSLIHQMRHEADNTRAAAMLLDEANQALRSECDALQNTVDGLQAELAETLLHAPVAEAPAPLPVPLPVPAVNMATPSRRKQVGGNHYAKLDVQPWDVMRATMTPDEFQAFLRGNAIKYLMRDKGSRAEDFAKAHHYIETLLAEMHHA
jgi:hypothetical protein